MKILLATGIYPPDVGGPATYVKSLEEEFSNSGHSVKVLSYKIEKKLPIGVRHFWYFLRTIFSLYKVDLIIAFDTFSTGLPSVITGIFFRKKTIVRIGGDFLWEAYIERSGDLVPLPLFYGKKDKWNFKEKIIFKLTSFLLHHSRALVFSTEWQKKIFEENYSLSPEKNYIIENFYGEKISPVEPITKNFIFAGRSIKLKNEEILKEIFEEVRKDDPEVLLDNITGISHKELMEKIKSCYAVILPSISDVSPNFILEATRSNKPFIMTKYNGLSDRIGDIGLFIDPSDKEDVKEKVLFLSKSENYKTYEDKIKNFNFTHSWEEIGEEFLNIYKKLVV